MQRLEEKIATMAQLKTAETQYEIHPYLRERWSPRVFSNQSIISQTLRRLLEAVRWSASSNNEQPWRFIYAFNGSEAFEKIFGCLSESNQKWVRNASVLMLTAIKEKFDNGKDNFHALHDLGLAVGNLTFQAQAMGIAIHQMAGVSWKKAHEVFNVPEGYHVATAIAIGYYGGDPEILPEDLKKMEMAQRKRKTQNQFSAEGEWPQ